MNPIPHFKLVEMAVNEANNTYFAIVELRTIKGTVEKITIPRSAFSNRKQLREALINAGAFCGSNPNWAAITNNLQRSSTAAACRTYSAALGWRDDNSAFVLPRRVISEWESEVRPPLSFNGDHMPKIRARGSLKEWKNGVARSAAFSSRMVFALCAGFAAPLLKFAELNSFGFLINGPSKSGKSTALVALGSLIGYAEESDLPNFRATPTAMDEILLMNNDFAVPANELGSLGGTGSQRFDAITNLAYSLAENRPKDYSRMVSGDSRPGRRLRRNILVGTGEESTEELAAAAHKSRHLGASLRFFDLPALNGDAVDVFDLCPSEVTLDERKVWFKQQCASIRNCARENHGKALREFLGEVVEKIPEIIKMLREFSQEFEKQVTNADDDAAVSHLAKECALIAAAGRIAVDLKIVPWTEELVIKCARRCFRAARRSLRLEADVANEGLRALMGDLEKCPLSKRIKVNDYDGIDSFRCREHDRPVAIVRAARLPLFLPDSRQRSAVLQRLHTAKALIGARSPAKSGRGILWAESQRTWPDGKRRRSIVIDLRRAGRAT
jgi:putative DNA primase/helicase